MTKAMKLYEILLPTRFNKGNTISKAHHKKWDKYVRKLAGGLTILRPVKGQWVDATGVYYDKLIPVRIACTSIVMENVALFSLNHYNQRAIMYYTVSNDATVVHKENKNGKTKRNSKKTVMRKHR